MSRHSYTRAGVVQCDCGVMAPGRPCSYCRAERTAAETGRNINLVRLDMRRARLAQTGGSKRAREQVGLT